MQSFRVLSNKLDAHVRPFDRTVMTSLQVIGGALFLALCSHISISLWFTPVPLTLQVLGVLFVGALLGPWRGTAAVLTYLGAAVLGLPVLALNFAGPLAFMRPSSGYLFGFVLGAFIMGFLVQNLRLRGFAALTCAGIVSTAAIYAIGLPWLAQFVGSRQVFEFGLYPFAGVDTIKILVVAASLRAMGDRL
jgi:biotin transport system substrate-specific component